MERAKGGAFARISSNYGKLLPTEKRIADVLLESGDGMGALSIGELAALSNASKATVTRFCKRLGFEGFRDFRVSAIIDTHKGIGQHRELLRQDKEGGGPGIDEICESNAQACADTKLLLNPAAVEEAAHLIAEKKRISLLGEGPVAPVALDFYQKLLRLGLVSVYAGDRRIQQMHMSLVGEEDVVVAFDLSGHTRSTIEMTHTAARNGASTIAVCNTIGSPLSGASGINLYGPGRMGSDISGTLAPRIALLCIVDCLFYAVREKLGESCQEDIVKTNQVILDGWV